MNLDVDDFDPNGLDEGHLAHDASTEEMPSLGAEHFNPYDPVEEGTLHGDPADEMLVWHPQAHEDTCAVVSQEFILHSLGIPVDEELLRSEAEAMGWYTSGGGTPFDAVGNLLELHGVPVEREFGASLDDLRHCLDQNQKVIVGIDADEIWNENESTFLEDLVGDPLSGAIPGYGANHAVEVIGIDDSNPAHPMVILNDPGTANGRGLLVPAERFIDAWEDSGSFLVHTANIPARF